MKLNLLFSVFLMVLLSFSFKCQQESSEVEDKRENIDGDWAVELDDGSVPQNYEVVITIDEDTDNKIFLSNFVNNEDTAYATLTGSNLTVPQQKVGNFNVHADGTISDNFQEITWTINMDGEDYTAIFTPGGITKKLSK